MDPAELPRDAARNIADGNLLKARQSTDNYQAVEIERDLFRSLFAIVIHLIECGFRISLRCIVAPV